MGYSTSLYAVDIAKLAAAIGSQDPSLLAKLLAATDEHSEDGETPPEYDLASLRPDSTLRVANEEILLDDHPVTIDKIPEALSGAGITVLEVVVHIPSRVQQSVLMSLDECFPNSGIEKILIRFECDDPKVAKNLSPGPFLFRPLPENKEEDDGESDAVIASFTHVSPEAIADLVSGSLSRTTAAHGSALEVFCHVLGSRLPDGGMLGDLSPLELDLPLEQVRHPVPIAAYSDFPVISYLTAQETAQEAKRLSKIRLAYPDDPDIEEAREVVRTCIKNAASQGCGIVSFYQ